MDWIDEQRDGVRTWTHRDAPTGVTVAFSGRGQAPPEETEPTAFLARRLARAIGLGELPIHWAKQIHGTASATVRQPAPAGTSRNVGECDVLVTDRAGAALVVQSADCVPILLSAGGIVGAAHAGWRGSARNAAGAAVAALRGLGADPAAIRAWIGPAIGSCCYEVGGDVAAQFAGNFVRRGCGGGFLLDLRAANVAQLEAAGVPRASIAVHPSCTKCGGPEFASYRRDGPRAGRMIALISRADG